MKLTLTDGTSLTLPDGKKKAASYVADLFKSRGQLPDEDRSIDWEVFAKSLGMTNMVEDVVAANQIRPLLSHAMELIIREPVEPILNITGLYTRVQSKGLKTQVLSGALGAVTAGDVQEHGTYPEVFFQIGGGIQVAWIGKSGIAAAFTDEALRYSTWDIMGINLRLMRNALLRHKEQKAVSHLERLGVTLFDNLSPSTSMFGVCTGRGLDMTANGSLTMDDLFKGMAHMAEEGFQPDVMLMSPLYFYLYLQDPVLRGMMMAFGGGTYFQKWGGQAGPLDPWSNGAMGSVGPSLGNRINATGNAAGETATGISGREHGMTSTPPLPAPYFPWAFSIVVSPFVTFDAQTGLGSIYLLSSGNVGYYLVDEDPVTVEWRDEDVESVKVKIRERYGFAVANEGQAIGIYKNIPLTRNYWDGVVRAYTLDVDSEISPTTDLSSVL